MVGRPSRRSGSGRQTLSEVWKWSVDTRGGPKWSGDPPGGPEVVRILPQRYGTGREIFTKVRKWSGDPPGSPEVVERPSRRSESGRENLP